MPKVIKTEYQGQAFQGDPPPFKVWFDCGHSFNSRVRPPENVDLWCGRCSAEEVERLKAQYKTPFAVCLKVTEIHYGTEHDPPFVYVVAGGTFRESLIDAHPQTVHLKFSPEEFDRSGLRTGSEVVLTLQLKPPTTEARP